MKTVQGEVDDIKMTLDAETLREWFAYPLFN